MNLALELEDALNVLRLIDLKRTEAGQDNEEAPCPARDEPHKIGAGIEWAITERVLCTLEEEEHEETRVL